MEDHAISHSVIRAVNAGISQYCGKHSQNMIFYTTYKWFCQANEPIAAYYAKRDKLHLSDLGSARLRQAFQTCLADTTLAVQVNTNKCVKKQRKRSGKKRTNQYCTQGCNKRVRGTDNLINLV